MRNHLMKYSIIFFLGIILYFSIGGCHSNHSNNEEPIDYKYVIFLKEMQLILAVNEPDSLKWIRVKKLFDKNKITVEEYRRFLIKYTQENSLRGLTLLQKIEEALSKDIHISALNYQKKIKRKDTFSEK